MAVILYKGPNKTVADIAARNAITKKIDHMVVTVLDAIADVNAGTGVATYRWNSSLNNWILISKSGAENITFATEELTISAGSVTASNVPLDAVIWDISVINGNVIEAEPRLEDLSVASATISGLGTWNGMNLRFTYAYGSFTAQVSSLINTKYDKAGGEISGHVLPSLDVTYDLGSPSQKWRDLYLSSSTIYLGTNAITVTGGKLTLDSGGGAIDTLDENSSIGSLADVDLTGITNGQILSWNGSSFVATNAGGSLSLNDLTDVDTTGVTTNSIIKFNGSNWVISTDSEGTTIDSINDISDVNITSPSSGDFLTYAAGTTGFGTPATLTKDAGFARAVGSSSDGSVIAVANTTTEEVNIYDLVSNTYVLRGVVDIGGSPWANDCDLSGDGTRLIVGEGSTSTQDGRADIFDWNGSAWVSVFSQLGSVADEKFGTGVALSRDGLVAAIGATESPVPGGMGKVYIYDWNGSTFVLRNSVTASLTSSIAEYGSGVSLNDDGTVLAVGQRYYAEPGEPATYDGRVYVYDWNGSAWVERSTFTSGEATGTFYAFGNDVCLSSNGTRMAVSALNLSGAQGKVYVYTWNGSSWSLENTRTETGISAYGIGLACTDNFSKLFVCGGSANILYIYDYAGLPSWVNTNDLTISGTLTLSGDPTTNLQAATKQYVDSGDALKLNLAGGTMTGALTLNADPSSSLHAATKQYVDTTTSGFLSLTGGTMTGAITLSGTPTQTLHAATKGYVDAVDASKLNLSGGTLTGALTLNADPTSALHAVTKQYADAIAAGFDPKASCKGATSSDIGGSYNSTGGTGGSGSFTAVDLTSNAIFDGVPGISAYQVNDRIAIQDQADPRQNGIYVVVTAGATGVIERAPDHDGTPANEVSSGNSTFIELGTIKSGRTYSLAGNGNLTLNTDNIVWNLVSNAGDWNWGTGLTASGNTINLDASINDLNDVNTSGATTDQVLRYNGSNWVPSNETSYGPTGYSETSTTSGVSIVDTAVVPDDGIYNIMIMGNPNSNDIANYMDVVQLKAFVTTGWNGSAATKYINVIEEFSRGALHGSNGAGPLTADVVFWNGSAESSDIAEAAVGTSQLRIKVSGYTATFEGSGQVVKMEKIL